MAYLVLARKYRPQGFADMTGQEHVVQTLSNALRTDRVAHALLFCGPRGCGKTTTARIVAKALNCERGPTPDPCGVCTPCREIAAGTDVDVQEIDAASNTGVDNVRELRESAKYLPARDRFKIFIVDEVHMLSKAAFNAFLKTLEEPPGHVKFLFATTDPQALPDTILSRCQRHNFRLVPLRLIVERLRSIAQAESVAVDDAALTLVARQAAGSMRDALSLLDQLFSACGGSGATITETDAAQALGTLDRRVVSDLAGALLARDASGVLQGVARAYDGGHDLKRLAEELATHLRNLVAASISGAPLDLPDHEVRLLSEQSAGSEPAELARLFELVHGALNEIGRAAQPRHALEMALLRAVFLAPSTSIQTLLGRVEALAGRGGPDGGPPPGRGGGGGRGPASEPARPPTGGGSAPWSASPAAPVASSPPPASPPAPSAPRPSFGAQASAPAPTPAAPAFRPAAEVAAAKIQEPQPAASPEPAKGRNPWERHLSLVSSHQPSPEPPPQRASFAAPEPPPPPPPAPAPPEPEPASPALPSRQVLPDERHARWRAVVDAVGERKRLLGSCLEHARLLTWDEGHLSLGFERGDIYLQNVTSDRPLLEELLTQALGGPVRLELVELAPDATGMVATLAEAQDQAEREARAERLRLGREHPAVMAAARLLGADIEDVKDLGGEIL